MHAVSSVRHGVEFGLTDSAPWSVLPLVVGKFVSNSLPVEWSNVQGGSLLGGSSRREGRCTGGKGKSKGGDELHTVDDLLLRIL